MTAAPPADGATERPAHNAYITHSANCWAQGDTRKCGTCRGLSLEAEAEDWARERARQAARGGR